MKLILASYVYENFRLYSPTLTLELIVWSICAGLMAGVIGSYISRRVIGAFPRRLIKDGIHTPEAAVTVTDTGFGRNFLVKRALREGGSLRKMVILANPGDFPAKEDGPARKRLFRILSMESPVRRKLTWDKARFYLPEEDRYTAEVKYEAKGTSVGGVILSVILIAAIGFAALYVIPELFQLLDNFLSVIG